MAFDADSAATTGLLTVHEAHEPLELLATLTIDGVPGGTGVFTVSVYDSAMVPPPAARVTVWAQEVPAGAPFEQFHPWATPLYVVLAGTESVIVVVPDEPPVLVIAIE